MGRYADALSLADEVLANMAAVEDDRGRFWCRIQLARVTYALGDYRGSTEHCRRAVESLDLAPSMEGVGPDFPASMRPLGARCTLDLGRIRHLQGRRDEARALLGRAAGQFQAMGMATWLLLAETAIQSLG
jgi:hypothetical protein